MTIITESENKPRTEKPAPRMKPLKRSQAEKVLDYPLSNQREDFV